MPFSRRQFLCAAAAAAMAASMPTNAARKLVVATWPNYHDPENLRRFTAKTGIHVETRVFGSNEEMMNWLLSGKSGFDIVVATNYAVNAYGKMGLLRPLRLERFPHYDPASQQRRFVEVVTTEQRLFGLPKNWGTTGFVYDQKKISSAPTRWRDFWDLATTVANRQTVVHDYQLTAIGNALKYYRYSFNSNVGAELDAAEALLLKTKPHLRAVSSLAYDQMRAGAWLSMAWSGDGTLLNRENPDLRYVIAEEGGEIWADYFTITRECQDVAAAEAFIDFLLTPDNNAAEVKAHGFPPIDERVLGLLPAAIRNNPIMFPPAAQLNNLEFGSRETLTHPRRAEILAKFKAA
ncbi:spermidine/putrescine ABC transporter substrate-binding protein [Permianibacter sp. IMCC34836]|uniref:ABC transporter substrate-binding protein n=1 Tax=Permianibacter fluminis TaxID=2738515 RepID=UPI0015535ADA|nr:spermidine/putrescine ABC transporter substrate-binding protein [Permianibacter fluminis]NQD38820.1 spermidine/putrescine ABC transporter substrate-binding protein [Permianibacter fluminis]